jgi:hypothetical protein
MNANERRACDGLLSDESSIMEDVSWIREHCERLEWELQATANALREAYTMLERGAAKPPKQEVEE